MPPDDNGAASLQDGGGGAVQGRRRCSHCLPLDTCRREEQEDQEEEQKEREKKRGIRGNIRVSKASISHSAPWMGRVEQKLCLTVN